MSQSEITFDGVSRFYGEVLGVNRITLSIPPGITSLVGPNGSGKTTLMNLMTGLIRPTEGVIRVLEVEPRDSRKLFQFVGYSTQFDSFPRGVTGRSFIWSFLRLFGYPSTVAAELTTKALERVRLTEAADRRIAGYSKGMRQRIKLAQAIAHDPRVLVLDEPLNGLDPLVRAETLTLFRQFAAEGRHVLVSTHILHEVDMISDQFILMSNGYVVAEGQIQDVRSEIREHPMQVTIRCQKANALAAKVFEMDHVVEVKLHADGKGAIVLTRDADSFYRALNHIALGDLGIESIAPADDTVKSVYEYLIGEESAAMMTSVWSQMAAVIRIEIRKTFLSKRSLWIYLLALMPAVLFYVNSVYWKREHLRLERIAAAHPIEKGSMFRIRPFTSKAEVVRFLGEPYRKTQRTRWFGNPAQKHEIAIYYYTDGDVDSSFVFDNDVMQRLNRNPVPMLNNLLLVFATTFQLYFIRLAIFFGCAGIFTNLFRGEMIDKSMHFYLLSPVPRPVLVAGKFVAGWIATAVIFAASTALQLFALLRGFDSASVHEYLANGGGWHQIAAYIGVTVLACTAYGSIFLAAGLVARNPAVPAALLLLWESVNAFIPGSLKMLSVVFYLQSLCPVEALPDKNIAPFLVVLLAPVEHVRTLTAVAALIGVSVIVLLYSSLKSKKLEINYSTE